jgi:hypothetical protein
MGTLSRSYSMYNLKELQSKKAEEALTGKIESYIV